MTSRVPMVSLERARELGDAMGMPARRTQSEAFRTGQQVEFIIAMGNWMMFSLLFRNLRIPLAEGVMVWPPDGLASPAAEG